MSFPGSSVAKQSGYIPNNVMTGNEACEGRKAVTTIIDFTLGLNFQLDLTAVQQMQNWFKSVQCLYIDNADNADTKTLTMGVTNQRIIVPAKSQGYYPILQPNPPVINFQSAVANQLKIQILNFFLPPYIWGPSGAAIVGTIATADAILDATVSNNRVNVSTAPTGVALVDSSSTIAAGGVAQQALAASPGRQRFIIANPDTATETLYMMFGGGAAGQIPLKPGMIWDESGTTEVNQAIWVVAATIGHAYTAYSL